MQGFPSALIKQHFIGLDYDSDRSGIKQQRTGQARTLSMDRGHGHPNWCMPAPSNICCLQGIAVGGLLLTMKLAMKYLDPYREQREQVRALVTRGLVAQIPVCNRGNANWGCCYMQPPAVPMPWHPASMRLCMGWMAFLGYFYPHTQSTQIRMPGLR